MVCQCFSSFHRLSVQSGGYFLCCVSLGLIILRANWRESLTSAFSVPSTPKSRASQIPFCLRLNLWTDRGGDEGEGTVGRKVARRGCLVVMGWWEASWSMVQPLCVRTFTQPPWGCLMVPGISPHGASWDSVWKSGHVPAVSLFQKHWSSNLKVATSGECE